MLDQDKFNNLDLDTVGQTTFGLVNQLQDKRPEVQVAAACALFVLLCEANNVPLQQAFTVTKNMINWAPGHQRPEFAGVAAYIKGEKIG